MKTITIFVQDNCPYCDQVDIPVGVNATKVYTNRDDYHGFAPNSVPVIQFNGMNIEGSDGINSILNLIKDAENYKE